MKNFFNFFFLPFLLIGIIFTQTTCEKQSYPTYHKTVGTGYVYDETNNIPLKGVAIEMQSFYKSKWSLFGGVLWHSDTVFSDNNGYFRVKFMDNLTEDIKIIHYSFNIADWGPVSHEWDYKYFKYGLSGIPLYPSDFEGKTIFEFDTIKFYKPNN